MNALSVLGSMRRKAQEKGSTLSRLYSLVLGVGEVEYSDMSGVKCVIKGTHMSLLPCVRQISLLSTFLGLNLIVSKQYWMIKKKLVISFRFRMILSNGN